MPSSIANASATTGDRNTPEKHSHSLHVLASTELLQGCSIEVAASNYGFEPQSKNWSFGDAYDSSM